MATSSLLPRPTVLLPFALLLLVSLSTCRVCNSTDLLGEYTKCDSLDSTRSLYYYYDPNANCTTQGAEVPGIDFGLPCNIDCAPGYYLPLGETACSICEPGSFSVGGGMRVYSWHEWPMTTSYQFLTFCANPADLAKVDSCSGWQLWNDYINIGNINGLHEIYSVVQISFHMMESGFIALEYLATYEDVGDLFLLVIDQTTRIELPFVSDYTLFTWPITISSPKYVDIKLIYYKNSKTSTGEGTAQIKLLEIVGLELADNFCTLCPGGRYQVGYGQDRCEECPIDTFSSEGATSCTPCPAGHYAYPGTADYCIEADTPCDAQLDSTYYYGPCEYNGSWSRTKYYIWKSPLTCDNSSVSLPADEPGQECEACPDGAIHDNQSHCVMCDAGTYANGHTCTACDAGEAATPMLTMNDWSEFPEGMTTDCAGSCTTDGFSLFGSYVGTGTPLGTSTDLYLDYTAEILAGDGTMQFEYEFLGESTYSRVDVYVNGYAAMNSIKQTNAGRLTATVHLSTGTNRVTWRFHRRDSNNTEFTGFNIYSIQFTNIQSGGADSCDPCKPGYYQPSSGQATCVECHSGTYAPLPGSTSCKECPENTYSNGAVSECTPCPEGTYSNEGSSYCTNPDCIYWHSDGLHYYNFSPYTDYPQYVSNGKDDYDGFFEVSYCGYLRDSPCTDSNVCEQFYDFNPYDPEVDYVSWSAEVSFVENVDPFTGFTLHYYNGSDVGCPEGQRTVDVIFICNPENFTALTLLPESSTSCSTVMQQITVYGCPVCSEDDFVKVEGDCEDGQMLVQYQKVDNASCNGIIRDSYEECGDIILSLGIVIGISIVIAACVIIMASVVVLIVMKHRRLKRKYLVLMEEHAGAGTEMDTIEETDVVEDVQE